MEISVASLAYVYTFEPRDRRGGILGSGVRGGGGGGGGGGGSLSVGTRFYYIGT